MSRLSLFIVLGILLPAVKSSASPWVTDKLPACAEYKNLPEKRFTELARQEIIVEGHVFIAVLDRRIDSFDISDSGEEQILRLTITSDKKKSRRYFIGDRITKCSDRWMPYLTVAKYMGKDFLVLRTATAWTHYGDGNPPPMDGHIQLRVLEITSKGEARRRLYTETRLECYLPAPCSVHLEKVNEEGDLLDLVWESADREQENHVVHYKWTKDCWAEIPKNDQPSTPQKADDICLPNLDTSASTPKFENPKKWL